MSNFFKALESRTPIEKIEHEFRLYYDKETGKPLFYSMDDKEGDYVIVDKDTYAESPMSIRVVDGRIKKYTFRDISKLVLGRDITDNQNKWTVNCHVDDISVVTTEGGTNWSFKQYED